MYRARLHSPPSGLVAVALIFLLLPFVFPLSACAAASRKSSDPITREGGSFPTTGRVVVRSGLAWLNETSPVFAPLAEELARQLAAKGLTVVTVDPTVSEPTPVTPLPPNADALTSLALPPKNVPARSSAAAASDASTQARAAELARTGKLPTLKLREYTTPHKDADLPLSVRSITPPDVDKALFALSQQKGVPLVRALIAIPGRLPPELTNDASVADHALVVRFAVMQPPTPVASLDGAYSGAAAMGGGGVGGVGSLGFGPPPSPSAVGGSTYGTPGGYVRGYENPAGPNDIWHRDSDFFQRDYMLKNSPPAPFAEPPSGLSAPRDGGPRGAGAVPPGRAGRYVGGATATWNLLQMECYDLAPVRDGKKPVMVWRAMSQQLAGEKPLAAALPDLAKAVFAAAR